MRKFSKPYKDNISDYGGSPLNVGPSDLDVRIRDKYQKQNIKRLVDRAYQLIEQLGGDDREGYTQSRVIPWTTGQGDLDSSPDDPISTGQFPFAGSKSPDGLQNDIFNRPKEVREYLSKGPNRNQPFPYTANKASSRIYSALDLEQVEPEPILEKKIPKIRPNEPVTKAQTNKRLEQMNKEWSLLLESHPQIGIQTKLTALLKKILYDVCWLKTKTRFPLQILVDFTYKWIRDHNIVMQALKDSDPAFWTGDNFDNLLSGLSTLYYNLRDSESVEITKPHAINYNSRFFY